MGKATIATVLIMLALLPRWPVGSKSQAAEKIQIGTSIEAPISFLPLLAAEEKGFGAEEGVQIEWVSFKSSVGLFSAVASGRMHFSLLPIALTIMGASRGLPLVTVADLDVFNDWSVYVWSDSPIKVARDLKGSKFGVSSLGALNHAYALALAKALGLEKDVRYAALGGIPQIMAGLRTKVVDALVTTGTVMIRLELEGQVRRILALVDHLPLEDAYTIVSTRGMIRDKPSVTRGVVRAILQGGTLARTSHDWSAQKMQTKMGWSQAVAQEYLRRYIRFSDDGALWPSRFANIRKLLVDYGQVQEAKTPPVAELYTDKFVPIR